MIVCYLSPKSQKQKSYKIVEKYFVPMVVKNLESLNGKIITCQRENPEWNDKLLSTFLLSKTNLSFRTSPLNLYSPFIDSCDDADPLNLRIKSLQQTVKNIFCLREGLVRILKFKIMM